MAAVKKKNSKPELAIQIAETVLNEDSGNANLALNLAKIYRQAEEPIEGARVLHDFKGEIIDKRGFWYEWGNLCGQCGQSRFERVAGRLVFGRSTRLCTAR